MRRKGILMTLLFLWVYLVGMGILLYPAINNYYTGKRMESSVEFFYGTSPTESTLDNPLTTEPIEETEPSTPYPELLEMLEAYNRELYEDDQSKLSSLAATEQPGVLFSVSGQAEDVFGVLSIPKLEMEMPCIWEPPTSTWQTGPPNWGRPVSPLVARIPTPSLLDTGGTMVRPISAMCQNCRLGILWTLRTFGAPCTTRLWKPGSSSPMILMPSKSNPGGI